MTSETRRDGPRPRPQGTRGRGRVSDLLTVREAAERLGRAPGFVRALVADGLVYGMKRGGRWYVARRSLDAWVDGGQHAPHVGRVVTPPRVWRPRDAA